MKITTKEVVSRSFIIELTKEEAEMLHEFFGALSRKTVQDIIGVYNESPIDPQRTYKLTSDIYNSLNGYRVREER